MHQPTDPRRIVGRSVRLDTDAGERDATVRTVGPTGVDLDVGGEPMHLPITELGRLRSR